MKIKNKKLKNEFLSKLMKESISDMLAQQGPTADKAPITDISLDEKVDHFLIMGERESIAGSQQFASQQESKKPTFLKSLMHNLFEANPSDDIADPTATPDASGGLDLGGDTTDGNVEKGPPPVPTPKIDIETFAKNIARLVNDYQTLIDPKRVIINRSKAYIEKNYNPEIAKQLMSILDTEYNLSPESLSDKENNIVNPMGAGSIGDGESAGTGSNSGGIT